MQLRFAVGLFAVGVVAACAGQVVDNNAEGPAVEGGSVVDAGTFDSAPANVTGDSAVGTPTPTKSDDGGHASFEDSGAVVVGTEDAGTPPDSGGGTLPPGTCDALSDCPYQSATNVSGVACTNHVCVITCNGDNYDVNGVLSDGCEVANPCPTDNGGSAICPVGHEQSAADNLGTYDCNDSDSAQNVLAAVPSDDRTHSPAVIAFDGTAGAAPVVLHIYASGGLTCQDDLNLNLQMKSPSTRLNCYSLTAATSNGPYTCAQTDATGLCQIQNGEGSYSDGSDIYITIAKLDSCPATETDDGAFELTGHL